jgi:diadenosine tetraphosphatase ApaH/serine/threonine PP2A family protein phosphatase
MKYAILADIHANLHALNAVLDDSKAQNCTHYACLGDIVGYGAYPKECVKIIQDMGMPCVKGNYDEYGSSKGNLETFTPDAAKAAEWTRSQLNKADREWLNKLPLIVDIEGFKLVHATLDSPQRWGYVFNRLDAEASFPYQETTVCFFGHTHIPMAYVRKPSASGRSLRIHCNVFSKFQFNPAKKYMVNPGSVGQPRDYNPKAAYATYDLDSQAVELRRVDYDIGAAQRAIENAGLPPRLFGR